MQLEVKIKINTTVDEVGIACLPIHYSIQNFLSVKSVSKRDQGTNLEDSFVRSCLDTGTHQSTGLFITFYANIYTVHFPSSACGQSQ